MNIQLLEKNDHTKSMLGYVKHMTHHIGEKYNHPIGNVSTISSGVSKFKKLTRNYWCSIIQIV